MSHDCINNFTAEGLTEDEQLTIFDGLWNGSYFADTLKEMVGQTAETISSKDGKMTLTLTSHNEPPLDDLLELSKQYPKAIFTIVYLIEEEGMFGASTSINGNLKDNWDDEFEGDMFDDEAAANWLAEQRNNLNRELLTA